MTDYNSVESPDETGDSSAYTSDYALPPISPPGSGWTPEKCGLLHSEILLTDEDSSEETALPISDKEDETVSDSTAFRRPYNIAWVMLGGSQMLYWNGLLNSLNDLTKTFYPQYPHMSDTIGIGFSACLFVCAVLAAKRGFVNLRVNLSMGVILTLLPLVTAIVVQFASGLTANVFLHLCSAIAGSSLAFWQAGHFGLAAYTPNHATRWVALGVGGAGLLTFAVYMLLSEAIFPKRSNVLGTIWGLQVFVAVMMALSVLALWFIRANGELRRHFTEARAIVLQSRQEPNRPKLRSIILEFWAPILVVAANSTLTYSVYPNIAPFRWEQGTATHTNALIGVFQAGDAIGKAIPTMSKWFPWVLWKPSVLYWVCGLRYLLLIPCTLMWIKEAVPLWDNFASQVIMVFLIAVTNGWTGAIALILAPTLCEDEKKRGALAAASILAVPSGVCLGMILSKLLVLALG